MGAGSSKQQGSTGSKHVFSSETPVQFSSNLVEALQSSAETDSTRAKAFELQIQARVAEELERIRQRERQTLEEIEKRLAEGTLGGGAPSTTTAKTTSYTPDELNLDTPLVPFAGRETTTTPAAAGAAPQGQPQIEINRDASRESVLREIEQLRSKLESRKRLAALDERVERAKADVVSCLRLNDRRPLDCWKEVEGFKREVARLEEAFVERVVG